MTPEQKILVQQSWQRVVPIAETASSLFYRRLFEVDPDLQGLFHRTDMPSQRRKLMETITAAVQGLDDLDGLVPLVEDLGRRHADYGVADVHYETVGAALLWTLEQGLGPAWTPQVATAWSTAYELLSSTMRNAAPQPA